MQQLRYPLNSPINSWRISSIILTINLFGIIWFSYGLGVFFFVFLRGKKIQGFNTNLWTARSTIFGRLILSSSNVGHHWNQEKPLYELTHKRLWHSIRVSEYFHSYLVMGDSELQLPFLRPVLNPTKLALMHSYLLHFYVNTFKEFILSQTLSNPSIRYQFFSRARGK